MVLRHSSQQLPWLSRQEVPVRTIPMHWPLCCRNTPPAKEGSLAAEEASIDLLLQSADRLEQDVLVGTLMVILCELECCRLQATPKTRGVPSCSH